LSPHLDIANVVELVRRQTDAEEDELLALKTELPYFLRQIQPTKDASSWGGRLWCPAASTLPIALHSALLWRLLHISFVTFQLAINQYTTQAFVEADPPKTYHNAYRDSHTAVRILQNRALEYLCMLYFRSAEF
jgi:hypothetical protein